MRKLIMAAALWAALPLAAGEDTWLKTDNPENASYFTPKLRVSGWDESAAFWPGLGIGWIVGSVVSVGFEGYVLAADPRGQDAPGKVSAALGGMSFRATPYPERRTHLSFDVLVGVGGSQTEGGFDADSLAEHRFFFISPGARLEFNLTPNIRLCPGASYMWTPDPVPGLGSEKGWEETMLSLELVLKKPDFE